MIEFVPIKKITLTSNETMKDCKKGRFIAYTWEELNEKCRQLSSESSPMCVLEFEIEWKDARSHFVCLASQIGIASDYFRNVASYMVSEPVGWNETLWGAKLDGYNFVDKKNILRHLRLYDVNQAPSYETFLLLTDGRDHDEGEFNLIDPVVRHF